MKLLTCLYFVCAGIFSFYFHSFIPSHVDEWAFRKWLWIYSAKWPNWAGFFTVRTDEWWLISNRPLSGHKFRRDFIIRTLIKENINFWKEDLPAENDTFEGENWILFNALIRSLDEKRNKIIEFSLDNAGELKLLLLY